MSDEELAVLRCGDENPITHVFRVHTATGIITVMSCDEHEVDTGVLLDTMGAVWA